MADALVYVYAVTDVATPEPTELVGVDDAPVRRIIADGLAALVSSVDAGRFSEDALRHSLEDLAWLERTARAHHAVVAATARLGPVAPVRLATVYLDDHRVRGMLGERAEAFLAALDRIRGRQEWGVKGYAVPSASREEEVRSGSGTGTGPGAAYLARRRAERDRAAKGHEAAVAAAEAVHAELAAVAVASRRYPPQDPRLAGHREEMVLNVAYLVDEQGAAALRQLVAERSGRDVRLELTGPWAAYSFATLEEQS
jgi:Gas vesicle synthesis protein GvpL/GvpF